MKTLTIQWQRLVDDSGQTCQRCGSTEQEVQKAFQSLKRALTPLGIEVILKKQALDPTTCAKDIFQSNRIWVGQRALEEWLDASVDKSPCESCCGELGDKVECRTVEVAGQVYEIIPAELIIKAGLLAAAELLDTAVNEPCGQSKTPIKKSSKDCCPKPVDTEKGQ